MEVITRGELAPKPGDTVFSMVRFNFLSAAFGTAGKIVQFGGFSNP